MGRYLEPSNFYNVAKSDDFKVGRNTLNQVQNQTGSTIGIYSVRIALHKNLDCSKKNFESYVYRMKKIASFVIRIGNKFAHNPVTMDSMMYHDGVFYHRFERPVQLDNTQMCYLDIEFPDFELPSKGGYMVSVIVGVQSW